MLKPKQIKYIELCLSENTTDKEKAQAINVSQKTICAWKKDPEFKREYDEAIREAIRYTAGPALRRQVQLLNGKSEMVAHLSAKDLLDRAGYKPEEKITVDNQAEEEKAKKIDAIQEILEQMVDEDKC